MSDQDRLDLFAAAALTGLLASGEKEYVASLEYRARGKYIQDTAWALAKAMLAAAPLPAPSVKGAGDGR